jgi:hypothetical protein
MKFIANIIKKFSLTKTIVTPLGRWKIEKCTLQTNRKIDLSNEDHCGPCGQYKLNLEKYKNDNVK